MESLVIYGAGKLGRQVYYHVKNYHSHSTRIIGFLDDTIQKGERIIDDACCLGGFQSGYFLEKFPPDQVKIVFAIGYSNMEGRYLAYLKTVKQGYGLFQVIHPEAYIESNTRLGQGVIIMARAVIDQGVTLGAVCYVDIGVVVGEDCSIGDNNFLAASCVLGGNVRLGKNNFLGLNSTVVNDVELGDNLTVNAQTLIHKNYGSDLQVIEIHKVRASSPLKI